MRFIKVFLLVLVFFLFTVFVTQNNEVLGQNISFKFDMFFLPHLQSIPLPVYFILLISFFIGALVCLLFLFSDRVKNFFALHRAKKRIQVLENEVTSLRTLPLKQEPLSKPVSPQHFETDELYSEELKAGENKQEELTSGGAETPKALKTLEEPEATLPEGSLKEDSNKD